MVVNAQSDELMIPPAQEQFRIEHASIERCRCCESDRLEQVLDLAKHRSWNFADEILSEQEEFRRRGGRFVIPVPELKVV